MKSTLEKKIEKLKSGELSEADFVEFLGNYPYRNLGEIKLDFHRRVRRGLPEVIFGEGKNVDHLRTIIGKFRELEENILITRVDEAKYNQLKKHETDIVYHDRAKIVTFDQKAEIRFKGSVLVLSAGVSDEPVAEEAYVSSLHLGSRTEKEYDVGVACISRIMDLKERLNEYTVVIVVAGMEGALPSVVAGLTSSPVIGVPTSVGYGANFKGISALLSMLNSCAGGLSVVNIDNGFGAAYQAALINQKIAGRS